MKLRSLNGAKGEDVFLLIQKESPQTIALVLAHLEYKEAALVLKQLPQETAKEVMARLAKIKGVAAQNLAILDEELDLQLTSLLAAKGKKKGGVKQLGHLLSEMEPSWVEQNLRKLSQTDSELAEKLTQELFHFETILKLDAVDVRTLLRETKMGDWGIALRLASQALKKKILQEMSPRAKERLLEELGEGRKQSKSVVEEKQKDIVRILRRLEAEGKISIHERKV